MCVSVYIKDLLLLSFFFFSIHYIFMVFSMDLVVWSSKDDDTMALALAVGGMRPWPWS